MGVVRREASIGANAVVDDQLTTDGVLLTSRIAQADGIAELYATASATGLRLGFGIGDQTPARNLQPTVRATAPLVPDDQLAQEAIVAGEVVSLSVLNTTAGAITLFYFIRLP